MLGAGAGGVGGITGSGSMARIQRTHGIVRRHSQRSLVEKTWVKGHTGETSPPTPSSFP
jgi:hypothetical protein